MFRCTARLFDVYDPPCCPRAFFTVYLGARGNAFSPFKPPLTQCYFALLSHSTAVALPRLVFMHFVFSRQWRRFTKPVWSIPSGKENTTPALSLGSTQISQLYPGSHFPSSASSMQRAWRTLTRVPWARFSWREKTVTKERPLAFHPHTTMTQPLQVHILIQNKRV